MLRKTMMVLATAAITAVLTASVCARVRRRLCWWRFPSSDHQVCDSAHPRGTLCAFPAAAQPYDAPCGYDYDLPWYGYYDPPSVAPDEQLTYPAPVVQSPPAPNAKVVSNPYSRVPSEEPDVLRPGELLVRFPPPKKISR